MEVGVVPVRASHVELRHLDVVVHALARSDGQKDVVFITLGGGVQAVGVDVCGVALAGHGRAGKESNCAIAAALSRSSFQLVVQSELQAASWLDAQDQPRHFLEPAGHVAAADERRRQLHHLVVHVHLLIAIKIEILPGQLLLRQRQEGFHGSVKVCQRRNCRRGSAGGQCRRVAAHCPSRQGSAGVLCQNLKQSRGLVVIILVILVVALCNSTFLASDGLYEPQEQDCRPSEKRSQHLCCCNAEVTN
mmetsp:Transcript_4335/g.10278  ORF Transcript_4335/g.10278 Transcript_4335/m.10278 type:complete len:248 (-) Transcript_4335:31-774(-)